MAVMSWQGKKVLVTGAGGFIGSHLAEHLVQKGAEVRAMVHYNALGTWGWLDQSPVAKDMEIYSGDITDQGSVRQTVKGMEVVFHLAALIAIPYSYVAPASYLRTNAEGTMNVLEAAREMDVERVVHTSTSEVYGTALKVPISEDHPLQGQSPYSASKIAADKMAEAYHLSFGLPVVTVRPFNTFGPRQSARAVIPAIITQLKTGDGLRLGNLHPTRDLNYVENTVEGFLAAAEASEAVGRTINLGSGREISIGKLAGLIGKLMGVPVEVEQDSDRVRPPASEVERLLADNSLAKKVLNWRPRVGLDEGLQITIDWVTSHMKRYRSGVYVL
jgi:NAD dependent epimerase/dehydratase